MSYSQLTRPWESGAGGGPRLRGRRADASRALPSEGAGPTIHFLSGNGFCGGVYWPFLRRFLPHHAPAAPAGRGYGVFLHDIEGHGASEAPARFSGIRALTRRIPEVMRDQGLLDGRPLIGMGHSFGAALTLRLAALHPGLFRAVVLLDPIVMPSPVWAVWRGLGQIGLNPMARGARTRRRSWPSRAEARERLRGRGIFAGWTEEALQCFVDHALKEQDGAAQLCCPPELEAQIYERPVFPWIAVRRAHLPILFLYGAQSYGFIPWAARIARRVNRQVRTEAVPGRHCFMLEHPDRAHEAVVKFLKSVG